MFSKKCRLVLLITSLNQLIMWMVMLLIMMKLTVLMKQQNAQVTDLSQATKDQNS